MRGCMHCFISGRVQGVFFRASTQQQAEQLNLVGYARNLPDGSVEVMACGELQALETLEVWLHQGPELAEVVGVVSEKAPAHEFSDFSIG